VLVVAVPPSLLVRIHWCLRGDQSFLGAACGSEHHPCGPRNIFSGASGGAFLAVLLHKATQVQDSKRFPQLHQLISSLASRDSDIQPFLGSRIF